MVSRVRVAVQAVVVLGVGTWAVWSLAGDKPGAQSRTPAGASAKVKAAAVALAAFQEGEAAPEAVDLKAPGTAKDVKDILEMEQRLRQIRAEKLTKETMRTIESAHKEGSEEAFHASPHQRPRLRSSMQSP